MTILLLAFEIELFVQHDPCQGDYSNWHNDPTRYDHQMQPPTVSIFYYLPEETNNIAHWACDSHFTCVTFILVTVLVMVLVIRLAVVVFSLEQCIYCLFIRDVRVLDPTNLCWRKIHFHLHLEEKHCLLVLDFPSGRLQINWTASMVPIDQVVGQLSTHLRTSVRLPDQVRTSCVPFLVYLSWWIPSCVNSISYLLYYYSVSIVLWWKIQNMICDQNNLPYNAYNCFSTDMQARNSKILWLIAHISLWFTGIIYINK